VYARRLDELRSAPQAEIDALVAAEPDERIRRRLVHMTDRVAFA
jgi:hypothetical protein